MAFLLKKTRTHPESGKPATYYQIGRWIEKDGTKRRQYAALGFVTERQAKAALARYEADLEGGVDPLLMSGPGSGSGSAPKGKIPTLADYWGPIRGPWPDWPESRVSAFLAAQGLASKALRNWDDSRRALLPLLGELRVDRVTAAEVDRVIAQFRADDYSARTLQIRVAHLRAVIRLAVEDNLVPQMPTFRRPKSGEKSPHLFHTVEQTAAVLAVLAERSLKRSQERTAYLAILLAVTTGLRPGELLTRRWRDLVGAELLIRPVTLPSGERWRPKASSDRTIPLPPDLLRMLREEQREQGAGPDGWMFPGRDDPSHPRTSYRASLLSACKEAGVPELHPHALRHTAATRWAWAGMDVATMMQLGGWRSPAIPLGVYAQSNSARARELLEATAPAVPARKEDE